jgi:biopolymer transport protein ExbD
MRIPNYRLASGVSINMTPMIDVTFLLIIFFLVSSHLAKQENNVRLDLPKTQTGLDSELSNQHRTSTVHVLPDGTYQMGGQSISIQSIQQVIAARHAETPGGLRVRIRTDRSVPYSVVSKLLKACTQAGTSDVVFAVYDEKG